MKRFAALFRVESWIREEDSHAALSLLADTKLDYTQSMHLQM
jgi:peroxiredoxin